MKQKSQHLVAAGINDLVEKHLKKLGLDSAPYLVRTRPKFSMRLVLLIYRAAVIEGLPPKDKFGLARHLARKDAKVDFSVLTYSQRQSVRSSAKGNPEPFRGELAELIDLSERLEEIAELAGHLKKTWGIDTARRFVVDHGIHRARGVLLLLANHHARGKAGKKYARWLVGNLNALNGPPPLCPWSDSPITERWDTANELREETELAILDFEQAEEYRNEPIGWERDYLQALRNPPPKPVREWDDDEDDEDEENPPERDCEDEDDEKVFYGCYGEPFPLVNKSYFAYLRTLLKKRNEVVSPE